MKFKLDKKSMLYLLIAVAIIVVGIVLDQVTKAIFQNLYQRGKLPIVLIPNVLNFSYALNNGAAWGSFAGNNVMFFCLTLVAVPVFIFIMVARIKRGFWGTLGFSMVISGAIGNAIDRAFYGDGFYNGSVRDFIETRFLGSINFVCNVADIFLTVGVVFIIVAMFFTDDDAIFKNRESAEKVAIAIEDNLLEKMDVTKDSDSFNDDLEQQDVVEPTKHAEDNCDG